MTDDNSTDNLVDIEPESLSEFNKKFFGEEQQEEVKDSIEEDDLATDNDEDEDLEPDESEEDDGENEEEIDTTPRGKKNRKSYQERLNEIYADKKAAEREVEVLRRELEAARSRNPEDKTEAPKQEVKASGAPTPDDVDEKGEPKYPLGEIDPKFVADLTRFTVTEELKADATRREQEAKAKEAETAQAAIQQHWNENLVAAEEDIPDIREKIGTLVEVFQDLEPTYGEYLAGTLMSCDHGPEIMYYLSQNIGEAQEIVASGPIAATLAIGRLEAQLTKPKQEEKRNTQKVSDAPPPPDVRTRGQGGKFSVRPDTRDLAAFRREFFKD